MSDKPARLISMSAPEDVAAGPLVRSDGEDDKRYAARAALMDRLFAIPDDCDDVSEGEKR